MQSPTGMRQERLFFILNQFSTGAKVVG